MNPPVEQLPDTLVLPTSRDQVCSSEDTGLDEVLERGTLRVALPNDSTSCFLWRGRILGFEYELLERFAHELDVELELVLVPSVRDRHLLLLDGEVDVIGGRLADLDAVGVDYIGPLHTSVGTVVQRVETGAEHSFLPIGELEDLEGERVVFVGNHGWDAELAGELEAVEMLPLPDRSNARQVMRRVATRPDAVGVVRSDLARLASNRFPSLDDRPQLPEISVGMHLGVLADSPALSRELSEFVEGETDTVATLTRRYFTERATRFDEPERRLDALSPYDDLFRRHTAGTGLDWMLVAAQAYQESRFDPRARSWAGARGLMQLMPRTARSVGVSNAYDPEQAVIGGVAYLLWLEEVWAEVHDPDVRLRFVLASYNAGLGHLADAQRLAEETGGDPEHWPDIEAALLDLQKPEFYRRPSIRYGFVRGREPVEYVRQILSRHQRYKVLIEAAARDTANF